MVTVSSHGGQCCGARHLYSFDNLLTGTNVNEINEQLSQNVPFGRRVEVTLNERQVTSPRAGDILRRLSDLGFVLTEHYMNHNHTPPRHNYVFTRCDTRRPLTAIPFVWEGQMISPGLAGDLPRVPRSLNTPTNNVINPNLPIEFEDGTPCVVHRITVDRVFVRLTFDGRRPNSVNGRTVPNRLDGQCYWELRNGQFGGNPNHLRIRNVQRGFEVGQTVRYTGGVERLIGQTGTIQRVNDFTLTILFVGDIATTINKTNCRVVETPPVPVAPLPPQRHTQEDAVVQVVRETPPVVVVYSTFHNVFRDGRIGAGYSNLEEASNAAPRCLQRLRRDISSDGTVTDVPV